jgi:outer membrane protein OmpA-like peptidoglycan-associated protein
MIGPAVYVKRRPKSEAEKPFWISYADLMTALMVLFLVAMSVAMMSMTKTLSEVQKEEAELELAKAKVEEQNKTLQRSIEEKEAARRQILADEELLKQQAEQLRRYQKTPEEIAADEAKLEQERGIAALLDEVEAAATKYQGVKVNKDRHTIDFGDRARFDMRSYSLTAEQAKLLRAFMPEVLTIANDSLGRKWLKQVVVEGFASPEGDYLYNLNLSLERSQSVLCALMAPPLSDNTVLRQEQIDQVRDLFLVGGYSFNATKFDEETKSYDPSRRVELRLEFLGLNETRPPVVAAGHERIGKCVLE